MNLLYAFFIILFLGIFLGTGLAFASEKFTVKKDSKLIQLEDLMPGANCGGCGFAGCSSYAEAVFKGIANPGLCSPGGQSLASKMSEIMGVKCNSFEKKTAYVFCKGSCSKTKDDYIYYGLDDCNAASMLFGGPKSCKYGCLHFFSCLKVCEEGAISKDEEGQITVDKEKCTGCGKCVRICPKGVIKLIPYQTRAVVACNSHDSGAVVRKVCDSGCIGCKICETKFPESNITVENFLASCKFDYYSEEVEKASEACPRKIIRII